MTERLMFAMEQAKKLQFVNYKTKKNIPKWVNIGKDVFIQPNVMFPEHGFGYEWNDEYYFPIFHTGKVIIENNVVIHSGAIINRGTADNDITEIGEGTRIDGGAYIAHNVKIGKHCLIHANAVISGSVKIGNNCIIGANSVINRKYNICDNVEITPLSFVCSDITEPGIYSGNPAKNIILDKKDKLNLINFIRWVEVNINLRYL